MKTGCPSTPVIKSVPAKQASSALYVFLSREFVLTAIITRMLKNMVHGHTSKLMVVTDISVADISPVRKLGLHSGIPFWAR